MGWPTIWLLQIYIVQNRQQTQRLQPIFDDETQPRTEVAEVQDDIFYKSLGYTNNSSGALISLKLQGKGTAAA